MRVASRQVKNTNYGQAMNHYAVVSLYSIQYLVLLQYRLAHRNLQMKKDFLGVERALQTLSGVNKHFSLKELQNKGKDTSDLPYTFRIVFENTTRNYDCLAATKAPFDTPFNQTTRTNS